MFAMIQTVLDGFAGLCGEFGLHPLVGFAAIVLIASVVTVVKFPRTYCGL